MNTTNRGSSDPPSYRPRSGPSCASTPGTKGQFCTTMNAYLSHRGQASPLGHISWFSTAKLFCKICLMPRPTPRKGNSPTDDVNNGGEPQG